jgi:hypothetical protein
VKKGNCVGYLKVIIWIVVLCASLFIGEWEG